MGFNMINNKIIFQKFINHMNLKMQMNASIIPFSTYNNKECNDTTMKV